MHASVSLSRWFPPPRWLLDNGRRRRLQPLNWGDLSYLEDQAAGSLLPWLQTPTGQRQALAVALRGDDAPAAVLDRWFRLFTRGPDLSQRWAALLGVPAGDFVLWDRAAWHAARYNAPQAEGDTLHWEALLSPALALLGLEKLGRCTVGQTATLLGVVPSDAARRWMTPAEARRCVRQRRAAEHADLPPSSSDNAADTALALQRGLRAWQALLATTAAVRSAIEARRPALGQATRAGRTPLVDDATSALRRVRHGWRLRPSSIARSVAAEEVPALGQPVAHWPSQSQPRGAVAAALRRLEQQLAELRRDLRPSAAAPAVFAES